MAVHVALHVAILVKIPNWVKIGSKSLSSLLLSHNSLSSPLSQLTLFSSLANHRRETPLFHVYHHQQHKPPPSQPPTTFATISSKQPPSQPAPKSTTTETTKQPPLTTAVATTANCRLHHHFFKSPHSLRASLSPFFSLTVATTIDPPFSSSLPFAPPSLRSSLSPSPPHRSTVLFTFLLRSRLFFLLHLRRVTILASPLVFSLTGPLSLFASSNSSKNQLHASNDI